MASQKFDAGGRMRMKAARFSSVFAAVLAVVACCSALALEGCGPPPRPTAQDAAFSAALRTSLPAALGPDYELTYDEGPLVGFEWTPNRVEGWQRETTVCARSKSQPDFAVYKTFLFNLSDAPPQGASPITPYYLARQTDWKTVLDSVPSDLRASFMATCAHAWPYGVTGRHIVDIVVTPRELTPEDAPAPTATSWLEGYTILWGENETSGGSSVIDWDSETNRWVLVE